jgi:serine/threonine-protein kinase
MPDPEGTVGGRYELLDPLGAGPSGTVWRGRDLHTGTECAVKLLLPGLVADEGAVARLLAVLGWTGELAHPGVVPVLDAVSGPASLTLVSALVPGGSLRALLDRRGALPAGAALLLVAELCEALAEAHRAGVVHGGVKPTNLLLGVGADGAYTVRLTDFGIAALLYRAAAHGDAGSQTASEYAAPEIQAGEAPSPAADVYAAGVILHELLCGRTPSYSGAVAADVPAGLQPVVEACLDMLPLERPSAAGLAAVLREAAVATPESERAAESGGAQAPPEAEIPADFEPEFEPEFAADSAEDFEPVREVLVMTLPEPDDALLPVLAVPREVAVRQPGTVATHAARRPRGPAKPRRQGLRTLIAIATVAGACAALIVTVFGPLSRSVGQTNPPPALVPVVVASGTSGISLVQGSTATAAPTGSATRSPSPTARPAKSTSPAAAPTTAAPTTAAPTSPPPYSAHTGRLFNAGSGDCLDISGGYYANGVVAQIWGCNNGANQVFTLNSDGRLTVDGGQYCLDDATSGGANGTQAAIWTCGGRPYQRWSLGGGGELIGAFSGLCLESPGNSPGTQLVLAFCTDAGNQRWSWS